MARPYQALLRATIAAAAIAAGVSGATAAGADAADARAIVLRVDIPACALSDALMRLGRLGRIDIGFLPRDVAGQRVPALRGTLTFEQALARLLQRSNLRYRRLQTHSYVVFGLGHPAGDGEKGARRV